MSIITFKHATFACAFATLAMVGIEASAATVRVTCEKRADRSRISVDGHELAPGKYSTVAISEGNMANAAPQKAVNGQIETDYDSDPRDIRAGAVPISPDFIVGGTVTGKVVDKLGNTVASDTVTCRIRR